MYNDNPNDHDASKNASPTRRGKRTPHRNGHTRRQTHTTPVVHKDVSKPFRRFFPFSVTCRLPGLRCVAEILPLGAIRYLLAKQRSDAAGCAVMMEVQAELVADSE